MDKCIGAGRAISSRKVMTPVLTPATEEQCQLALGKKRVATISGNFGDRLESKAVLDGDRFRVFEQRDCAARKVTKFDPPSPCVLDILHRDAEPAVLFVERMLTIVSGLKAEIFDADVGDATGPVVLF